MNLKPLRGFVLVKLIKRPNMTIGGLYIPDMVNSEGNPVEEANVMALGEVDKHPYEVKVGDKVLVSPFDGAKIKDGEEEYFLVTESKILGVIE